MMKRETAIETVSSSRSPALLEDASTADLLREAMSEAKELVRIEVELARAEVKDEVVHVRRAAIAFGVAAGALIVFACMVAVAVVLALGATPVAAVGVAAAFLVIGTGCAAAGYAFLPARPLERTRQRLRTDMNQLKEHIA